jgi:hypothetical protein
MLTTICRLYDSHLDASRVVLLIHNAVSGLQTSTVSNNCDGWYRALKTTRDAKTAGRNREVPAGHALPAASLVMALALPGIGEVVGAGWLAIRVADLAACGETTSLLCALSNAGIRSEDADVLVEGLRRGGTLVATCAQPSVAPLIEKMMDPAAVDLGQRCDLYRKTGWMCFDSKAIPYTADQVRAERALHAP